LLTLPAKKSGNAYNISNMHFASGLGIVDAASRRPCSMSVHRGRMPRELAWLVLREALAVGGRVPLAAEHDQNVFVISS
jgi:hypothetical protein